MFRIRNPSFLVMHSQNPSLTNVSHQQNSHKIIFTGPVLMPTVSAIRCTLIRRFCRTTVSTARQFSSQTTSDGFVCLDGTWQPSVLLWHMWLGSAIDRGYPIAIWRHS